MNQQDIDIIRQLAGRVAEIAALPVHEEKRTLWRKLNAKQPERPMVTVDNIPWNEMNIDDELTLRCEDEECRGYETILRRILFRWKHFPVDMVVEPFIRVRKAVTGYALHSGMYGFYPIEDLAHTDPDGQTSHKFKNQLPDNSDLEKLRTPKMGHDTAETARRLEVAEVLFGGLLDIRADGLDPYVGVWDLISLWMSVEGALYAIVDRPEFVHKLVEYLTTAILSMLDQLEEQGLLCGPQSLIHCTGAFTDELPAPGYDPERPRTKDLWMFGLAQMFSTVSPAMFKEYEVDYASRICKRFGLVYYGCCDPLSDRMDEVRMLPNVRKVSISPWADQERAAREMGDDFVFSRKPSPALLATDTFKPQVIRDDLMETRKICDKHGCPLELVQKDISTVRHEPERLSEWGRIAMEVAGGK
ncbi:MAG: hypothetical protein HQ559_07585 [Lentisphaerae bacterium]|nr:hypothetical protein [Lentisphaerota bacterium]